MVISNSSKGAWGFTLQQVRTASAVHACHREKCTFYVHNLNCNLITFLEGKSEL